VVRRGLAAVVLTLALSGGVRAETPPRLPDQAEMTLMVWSTLSAVDQANRTGNFTVLRDLGAPGFREANTAATLARVFSGLLSEDPGLGRVMLSEPVYREPPRLTDDGKLYMAGSFPGRPVGIGFELLFEPVNGEWLLFGISVVPVRAASGDAATDE
jgi:hypothetical protein